MSKMDNLRAMREARYAEAQRRAAASSTASRPRPPVAPPAPAATKSTKATSKGQVEPAAPGAEELCGHRNMSGRTCTREKGHAAKSHRYS